VQNWQDVSCSRNLPQNAAAGRDTTRAVIDDIFDALKAARYRSVNLELALTRSSVGNLALCF
jgi:hypothetical protein